jgi:chemotaxis response regulator CheB
MDLRAVLVDDSSWRATNSPSLSQVGGVEVIGQAGNGIEALTTIDRLQPDVVFLDVRCPADRLRGWRGGC